MPVYDWDTEKAAILSRLTPKATLKIAVKLLDEPLLVRGWIEHHAKIAGYENLIIADNGSSDPTTLAVYREFGERVTIFRFKGNHNQIHWHPRFADLFRVIQETARFFAFFDVDERLIWSDGSCWRADPSIVEQLKEEPDSGILPATWLLNTLNSFDTFSFLDSEGREMLENNLRWGKPILPSFLAGMQPGMHNAQFDRFEFASKSGCHFFLPHLTRFPEQRILASKKKILSRGAVPKDIGTEALMNMDFSNHPDKTMLRFVSEIREMKAILDNPSREHSAGNYGTLTLNPGGSISFSSASGRDRMREFLANGPSTIRRLFGGSDEEEGLLNDAPSLLALALALRSRGPQARAEILFRRGMAIYPEFLDQYGGPAFKKELLRMLLARQEWDKAEALIPKPGEPGGNSWHEILFARAYAQHGEPAKAAPWWQKVLENEPGNGEAKANLQRT